MAKKLSKGLRRARCVRRMLAKGTGIEQARAICKVKGSKR